MNSDKNHAKTLPKKKVDSFLSVKFSSYLHNSSLSSSPKAELLLLTPNKKIVILAEVSFDLTTFGCLYEPNTLPLRHSAVICYFLKCFHVTSYITHRQRMGRICGVTSESRRIWVTAAIVIDIKVDRLWISLEVNGSCSWIVYILYSISSAGKASIPGFLLIVGFQKSLER